MQKVNAKSILATIMLVSLLGTAGIALPYPVLSPYFMSGADDPLIQFLNLDPKILLGLSLATYPLGLLIGSNIIGSLSDFFGRKRVLVISLVGSVIGYLITGLAAQEGSFVGFLLARIITGFCEGNISIARAIAVELAPQIDPKRSLALLYSTVYAGWLIGPLAGGYLMPYGVDITFYVGGAAVLAALLLVITILPTQPSQKSSTNNLWYEIKHNHSATLLKKPEIRAFFVYYFIYTLGINAFYEFYPLWMVEALQFNSKQIAWVTVTITTLMILVSATFAAKVPEYVGEKNALLGGNFLFAALIIIATVVGPSWVYLPLSLTGAVIAVINLVFPIMLSNFFGHLGQGKVMGLQVSIFCLTNVIIAIIGSLISLISATTTLWVAAALIAISVLTFITPDKQKESCPEGV